MKKELETINYRAIWMMAAVVCILLVSAHASAQDSLWQEHMAIGKKAVQEGLYADAERAYLAALKEAEGFGPQDPRFAQTLYDLAALYYDLAALYRIQAKYAEAEPLLKRALAILEDVLGPEDQNVATSLNALAGVYAILGNFADAEKLYKRALAIQEKLLRPDEAEIANSLDGLALVYTVQSKYFDAEQLYKHALAIREKVFGPDHPAVANSLSSLALLYFGQVNYTKAEPLYHRSIRILEKTLGQDHPSLANSLSGLAGLYMRQGRRPQAESLFKRALAIQEKALGAEDSVVAGTLSALAWLNMTYGKYAEAESLYTRALAIDEKKLGPKHPVLAYSISRLAEVYIAKGQYTKAEPMLRRALEIAEETLGPDNPAVGKVLTNLASLYYADKTKREYPKIESLLRRALAIQEKSLGPNHPYVALSLRDLARLLTLQGRHVAARPLFERARRIHLALLRAEIDEEMYDIFLKAGKSGLQAYAETLAAIARNPTLQSSPVPAEVHAFFVAEQVRAGLAQTALTKAASRQATRDPVTSDLARKVQDLSNHRREVSEQLTHEYEKPTTVTRLRVLQDAMQQLGRELDEALDRLTKAFPKYTDLIVPEPVTVETVQKMLRSDEALVSFFTLDDRLLIWLLRPHKELVYRDIEVKKTDLTKLVSRVRLSLDQSKNPKLTAGLLEPVDVDGAHRLYKILFGEIRDSLGGVKHLIVVPDELLLPLPFGALLTHAEGNSFKSLSDLYTKKQYPDHRKLAEYSKLPWLAREMAITVLPSATSLRALRQVRRTKRPAGEPFIGFGDPLLYGSGNGRGGEILETRGTSIPLDKLRKLPRLPGTRQELLAVAKALGANPSKAVYLGENATELIVSSLNASGRLGKSEVVAFATHALIAGQVAGLKQPALVLTPPDKPSEEDDGLLDLEDIVRLKLDNTDWVILSACNTALEKGSGEGLSGLVRAFFFAGTRSLLVSHWSVADQPTQALMTEVFQRYARDKTMPRSEALRQGMLALMAKAKGATAYFAHPFAWAPFFLVGEGSSPLN